MTKNGQHIITNFKLILHVVITYIYRPKLLNLNWQGMSGKNLLYWESDMWQWKARHVAPPSPSLPCKLRSFDLGTSFPSLRVRFLFSTPLAQYTRSKKKNSTLLYNFCN